MWCRPFVFKARITSLTFGMVLTSTDGNFYLAFILATSLGMFAGLINGLSIKESSFIANDLAAEMISKLSRITKPSSSIKERLSSPFDFD